MNEALRYLQNAKEILKSVDNIYIDIKPAQGTYRGLSINPNRDAQRR